MAIRKNIAGKAYLKIDLLVKTPLHRRNMEVRRSGLWAPDDERLLKISISRWLFCIRCNFPISIFVRLGYAGWYYRLCVTNGSFFFTGGVVSLFAQVGSPDLKAQG